MCSIKSTHTFSQTVPKDSIYLELIFFNCIIKFYIKSLTFWYLIEKDSSILNFIWFFIVNVIWFHMISYIIEMGTIFLSLLYIKMSIILFYVESNNKIRIKVWSQKYITSLGKGGKHESGRMRGSSSIFLTSLLCIVTCLPWMPCVQSYFL